MEIYLIAEPKLNNDEVQRFLTDIGAPEWKSTANTDAQQLIEINGRLCYNSFKPGLNRNVTRVRESSDAYIKNLLKQQHGSVLEHAQFSFIFTGVSRICTHELVRHRVGIAISQESMRYVIPTPDRCAFDGFDGFDITLQNKLGEFISMSFELYEEILGGDGYDDLPFSRKKELTSLARRILPSGILTTIGWSANVRTLRHVIELRTSDHAEIEIRELFTKVKDLMQTKYPTLFSGL